MQEPDLSVPAPDDATAAATGGSGWLSDWGGWLTLGVAVYAAVLCVWMVTQADSGYRGAVENLSYLAPNLAVSVLAWRAARHPAAEPRLRHLWYSLAVAYFLAMFANAAWFYYANVIGGDPTLSWVNIPYLLFYPIVLWGLLSAPRSQRTAGERLKFALDLATVVVAASIVIWYFIVRPTVAETNVGLAAVLITAAYPLGDALLLLGVAIVTLRQPAPGSREALTLVLVGLIATVVADLAYGEMMLTDGTDAPWTMPLYMVAFVLMSLSAHRQLWRRGRSDIGMGDDEPRPQPFSLFPYLAVAIGYGLLLAVGLRDVSEPLGGLIIGAVVLTGLVVARQIAAVRENARLLSNAAERRSEARFRSLVQHSSDVIIVLSDDTTIRYISPSVTRVLGYEPDQLTGTRLTRILHPEDVPLALGWLAEAASDSGTGSPIVWRVRRSDSEWCQIENVSTNLLHDPSVRGVVLNTRDVSERKQLEEQLTHQAFHDPLTGLANRALFRNRVEHALSRAERSQDQVTVLFLDLDNFKAINDSFGHAEGDRLLVLVAERLLACLRAADTAARFGGDEFALLVDDVHDTLGTVHVAERITQAMSKPLLLDGREVFLSASIGIASTTGAEGADDLLRNADVAMYIAKGRGKGRYAMFEPRMHVAVIERLELEADLRRAVDRGDFTLAYQPIVALRTGAVTGLEALIRWRHRDRGWVSPATFVPIAEETGLIVPLGRWILEQACRHGRLWQMQHGSTTPLSITVNISGRQLQQPGLDEDVARALEISGLDPGSLVLELTESVLVTQTELTLQRLQQLKRLGVQLAIDDFGTGYSSLSYLQRFPIDILKVAKPFVDRVAAGGDESALARAIIALGDTLRLRTVAEGIESARQFTVLQELGCEMGQGYFFARPLSTGETEVYLRSARRMEQSGGPEAVAREA